MLIRGKGFEVLEAYPKEGEGQFVNHQQFIDNLSKYFVKNVCYVCALANNRHAKPKTLDTKFDFIYKHVFTNFL